MKKITFLFAFFLSLFGGSQAWADTLTANFDSGLPEGWSLVGSVTNDDTRCRTGKGIWTDSKSTSGNYVITEVVEGTFEFYARAFNKSYASTVVVYEYTGSALGEQLYTTGSMYTSSTPSWSRHSFTISSGTQLAIVLNYAAIDDVTYTQMEVADGPALVVKDGSKVTSPYAFDFGLVTPGTTHEFKLTNPGTAAVEGLSVSETGSFGATLSATTIAAGGEATLTITMPAATGSSTITISSTTLGIEDFVINASGTVKDPKKVFLDFSDGQMPDGWTSTKIGSYAYDWTVTTGYAYLNAYGSTNYESAFVSPLLTFENGETILFETAKNGSSDYYTPGIKVQYSLDGSIWTDICDFLTDDIYNTWTKRSVNIPVEGVKYIRFSGWYVRIRNIYGGELPLNPTPKDLAYSNVGNTSALLSWTSTASKFNIQYKGTGDADWTTIENVTANPYTLTGLTAETTYQVKVQADHGVNGLSDYTEAVSFTTKPNPISTYPYTENFNSLTTEGQIPDYWDNSEGTTTTNSYKWSYSPSYGTGHEGKCVRFDSYNNGSGKTNFLKTPSFFITEGTPMKLSFWYKNPTGGDFSIYASTDGGTTYPTELATGLTGKSEWTQVEINIPAAVYGNNVVIVFKGTSNYGSGDARIYLDDVEISEISDYAMSISGSDVTANTIAFGTVKNTTTTKTFTISNDGGSALTGVTVESSDDEVFTVSETDFDIAVGATKDITVTFVKAVEGDYNETITITQANVATPIVLTATATYQTPTPATMEVTLDDVAVGASVDFGTVNKATVKTIKVTNAGEATLNATIAITGADASCFTSSTTSLEVAGGSNETFTITFNSDAEDVAKTATVTLTAADLSPVSFNVTGTYSDFWTEDFESGSLSTGWLATNWSVTTFSYTAVNNTNIAKAGASASTIITPRLSANKDDILTWDALFDWYDEGIKVEYSTDDMETWTIADIDGLTKTTASTGSMANAYCPNGNGISTRGSKLAMSFTAPSTGNYYFRFTSSYSGNGVDNFAGFKLNIPDHIMAITGSSIPTSGSYSPSMKATKSFNATVTVKESRGVAEEDVVAKLYMGSTVIGTSDPVDFEANETKMITIECTPTEAATEGVEMHIEVEYAGGTLSTTPETRYVAEFVRLDMTEDSEPTISTGYSAIYDLVTLTRNFVEGWNTFVAPCAVTLNDIHAGAIAYSFSNYEEGTLTFTQVNSATLTAATPYIIYVPSKLDDKVLSWESPVIYSSYVGEENIRTTHNEATFQGTYAPMAAGTMTGKWGVTDEAKIAKGTAAASMDGFRAYFTLPDGASARLAFIDEDGTTTVINALELNQNVEGVYNLQGQKVERLQKGLYIVNGHKVVRK